MKQISTILGVLGVLLVAISALVYLITNEFSLLYQIIGFVGLALAFFYVYVHIDDLITTFGSRSTRYSAYGLLLTLLCVVVLVLVNYIVHRHPALYDATENKLHSLSPQTRQVLEGLEEPVRITTFFDEGSPAQKAFSDMSDSFRVLSDKVELRYVDPYRNPALTEQYGVKTADTIVIAQGDNERKVTTITEEEVINAIIAVTRKSRKKICFLEGHGERSLDDIERQGYSIARSALQKQSFDTATVKLYESQSIPEDCAELVVAGPEKPLLDKEKTILDAWLRKGGRMIFMLDPGADPALADYLATWGIKMDNDMVVDPVAHTFVGDFSSPICVAAGIHKITEPLQQMPLSFPIARSLEKMEEIPFNGWLVFLLRTSESAWGESDLSFLEDAGPDSKAVPAYDENEDIGGPLNLAALVTYPVEKESEGDSSDESSENSTEKQHQLPNAMIAVFGDSDFASNAGYSYSINGDMFMNTVSFLAAEEDLLSIRPKDAKSEPLSLTQTQASFVWYMSLLVLPGIPFLLGVYTYVRKKNL